MAQAMSAAEIRWREAYERVLSGAQLGAAFVRTMPGDSIEERVARANTLIRAMQIVKVPTWRPSFPYA